jgi:hypothetical protein
LLTFGSPTTSGSESDSSKSVVGIFFLMGLGAGLVHVSALCSSSSLESATDSISMKANGSGTVDLAGTLGSRATDFGRFLAQRGRRPDAESGAFKRVDGLAFFVYVCKLISSAFRLGPDTLIGRSVPVSTQCDSNGPIWKDLHTGR